jgi:hypothetical protein
MDRLMESHRKVTPILLPSGPYRTGSWPVKVVVIEFNTKCSTVSLQHFKGEPVTYPALLISFRLFKWLDLTALFKCPTTNVVRDVYTTNAV